MRSFYQSPDNSTALFLSEEKELIMVKLVGRVSHESYRALFEKVLEVLAARKYRKIIYNLAELTHSEIHSRAWFTTIFLPKVAKNHGMKFKTAVVKSANSYENATTQMLVKMGGTLGFNENIQLFSKLDEAERWITGSEINVS
jgi:lysine/ornithine N-monooxygenase